MKILSGKNTLHDKNEMNKKDNADLPFNDLPLLPPAKEQIESVVILKQLVKS